MGGGLEPARGFSPACPRTTNAKYEEEVDSRIQNEDDERKFWAARADSTEYLDWASGKRSPLPLIKSKHVDIVGEGA
jgi:hypothetical protein